MAATNKILKRVGEGLRSRARNGFLRLVRAFGMMLIDPRTGKKMGRVLMIPWGSRIHVIGLWPDQSIQVKFMPQERLTYWKQEIGFIDMDRNPDMPSLHRGSQPAHAANGRRDTHLASSNHEQNHDAAHS